MDFIDTNILIEQFKKHTKDEIDKDVFGKSISSISALEFLNVMLSVQNTVVLKVIC